MKMRNTVIQYLWLINPLRRVCVANYCISVIMCVRLCRGRVVQDEVMYKCGLDRKYGDCCVAMETARQENTHP